MTEPSGGRLLFVDLNCSEKMRAFIGAVARVHVLRRRTEQWLARLVGRPQSNTVLLSAPPGSAPNLRLPASVTVKWRSEFESDESMRDVKRWTEEVTTNLLEGPDRIAFPELYGVSLGQLAKLRFQLILLEHAELVSVLRTSGESGAFTSCDILTGYANTSRALLSEASAVFSDARRVTPRGFSLIDSTRRLADGVAGAGADAPAMSDIIARPPLSLARYASSRVLMVAESRPMSQMFDSIENALFGMTGDRALRLQFAGPDPAPVIQTPAHLVHIPNEFIQPDGTYEQAFGHGFRVRADDGAMRPVSQTIVGKPCVAPLHEYIPAIANTWFPLIATHLAAAKRLMDQLSPSLVVVGNDRWYVGQAFVQLARQRGIPTLGVQDGVSGDIPLWSWIGADHFATSGKSLYDFLVAHGVDAARLSITGQPRYDRLVTLGTPAARLKARESLRTQPGKPVVTFATQPLQEADFVRSVIRGILMVPGVHLVVRPHPSGDTVDVPEIARAFPPDRCEVRRNDPVEDLLLGSDVLVTQHSTVAVEAALLGVPVITVDFVGSTEQVPYHRLGISQEGRSATHIASVLQQLLDEPSRRATAERTNAALEYLMGPSDGRASQRVAELIVSLLSRAPATVGAADTMAPG